MRALPGLRRLWITSILLTLCVPSAVGAVVDHSGAITADTTWTADDVHRIVNNVTVNAGVILTIEPGTIVKFETYRQLDVHGALDAAGLPGAEIVFTSYRDDSFGGDTNGDGPSVGERGDWNHIDFSSQVASDLVRLEHLIVRYGGRSATAAIQTGQNTIFTLRSVEVSESSSSGVYTYGNGVVIEDCVLTDNENYGAYLNGSSNNRGENTIRRSEIRRNKRGVFVNYCEPMIADNVIADNSEWGIYHNNAYNAPPAHGAFELNTPSRARRYWDVAVFRL